MGSLPLPQIASAGNTAVPALLSLEHLGFSIEISHGDTGATCRATRGDAVYTAEDPVAVLGLVKLIELRGWSWTATDAEVEAKLRQYSLA